MPTVVYRYLKITLLFFFVISSNFFLTWSASAQNKPVSISTQQRILATYQLVKDSLLTQKILPFAVNTNSFSTASITQARQEIFKGNLQPVRAYLLHALNSEDVTNNPTLYVAAKSVWIDYLISTDSLEKAYIEGVKLVQLADSLKIPNRSLAYIAAGKAGCTLEQYYSYSAECAAKAMAIARQNGDKALEAKARLIVGVLARGLFWGSSGRSIPHYNEAIKAATEGRDTLTLIRTLYLKHSDIAQPGDVNEGFSSIEQAARLTIRSGNLRMVPYICLGLVIDLEAIGEKDKSTELLLTALKWTQQFRAHQMELHLYINLSEYYTSRKMYDSALYYLNSWKYIDPLDPGRKPLMFTKANVYYEMGNYQKAATLYRENHREHENAYMLHGQNVLSKWEATIRMQDKEHQLLKETQGRRQLTWIISGIIVILFITLLALVWQRSLRKRLAAQNRLISRQSQKLEQSLAEKEMLLKEIHHRVKNNLQVIDSLLDLHQDTIHQPGQQEEAFVKARSHVHTIAMIHQNLYQQQNVAAVDMQSFVDELFLQTDYLINKHKKDISFNSHTHGMKLDIDTAVPLGLILNELLTNAFKYVVPVVSLAELSITISQGNGPEAYVLQYSDNGPGLPGGLQTSKAGSLGLQLVKQLSRQIGGRLSYTYNNGSHFAIPFLTLKGRKEMD